MTSWSTHVECRGSGIPHGYTGPLHPHCMLRLPEAIEVCCSEGKIGATLTPNRCNEPDRGEVIEVAGGSTTLTPVVTLHSFTGPVKEGSTLNIFSFKSNQLAGSTCHHIRLAALMLQGGGLGQFPFATSKKLISYQCPSVVDQCTLEFPRFVKPLTISGWWLLPTYVTSTILGFWSVNSMKDEISSLQSTPVSYQCPY